MFTDLSFPLVIALFVGAAVVIAIVGSRLAHFADVLADRTGLGEAVAGAVLLGATTSISGAITSISAASSGDIDLAYANSLGGIAAQTAFLAVGDVVFRRANLEHAAPSVENLTQSATLILLLTVPLIAALLPPITVYGIHPASVVLVVVYLIGVRAARHDKAEPMWLPRRTPETRLDSDEDDADDGPRTAVLVAIYAVMVVIVGVAGWIVARTGLAIAAETGVAQSVVGALLTATVTSLPELVTTIAAVRRGALQLAVGGIIGGNTFDVLFLSASDVAYREGSLYHGIGPSAQFWAVVGIAITAVLLIGLIRRERSGPANVGVETLIVLAVYVGAAVTSALFLRV